MRQTLFAIAALCFLSCEAAPPRPSADCERACARLRELGCEDGKPTATGAPCEQFLCEAHGVKLQCIATAVSCEDASQKQVKGCK